jgi:2-C-methyl-D-erythritol 4-phosphate cytidylyltransferase
MSTNSILPHQSLVAIVPAAGIGSRMQAAIPKQYLTIKQSTVLEHTVNRLLAHPNIVRVIIVRAEDDSYFLHTSLVLDKRVHWVIGGEQRVDSVLAGLRVIEPQRFPWVLVHDAARPCVSLADISALINACAQQQRGGLLAYRAKDTMKRAQAGEQASQQVNCTVSRQELWHALTPQLFKTQELIVAIERAKLTRLEITDESSALEATGYAPLLVPGASDNIKITTPDDLALAEFILTKQQEQTCA